MAKPWLEEGAIGDVPGAGASSLPAAKVGLGVFLAVVGSLVRAVHQRLFMRMHAADWRPLPAPRLLWFNTGVLILSSVALQCAQVAARRGRMDGVRAACSPAARRAVLSWSGSSWRGGS